MPTWGVLQETRHSAMSLGPPTDLGAGELGVFVYSLALRFLLPYRNAQQRTLQCLTSGPPKGGCLERDSRLVLGWKGCLKSLWGTTGNKLPSHILILAWTHSHPTCVSWKVLPSKQAGVGCVSQKFSSEVEQQSFPIRHNQRKWQCLLYV